MSRYRLLSVILCVFTAAAMPLGIPADLLTRQSLSSVSALADHVSDTDMSAMALGPGIDNLSLGDEYATYQWGLKNYGEFQLTELISKFSVLDYLYGNAAEKKGPGTYETKVTHSISGIDINIKPAWSLYDQAETKRPVTVAVIDTGIDYLHQDLQSAIWTNPGEIAGDGIDNDGDGYVDDIHGWNFYNNSSRIFSGEEDSHGTHAAGTIAATRKAYGIAGIASSNDTKLMILKALGGSEGTGSPDAVIAAIQYAETHGASICNLSLGTLVYNERLANVISDSKMLFVIAAGNGDYFGNGYNTDKYPVYPASLPYDNIISVGNLMFDGSLDSSSNYGAVSVDIAAPGTYILSCIPDNDYAFMSGTSMAAPMVTGVAAMVYSYRTDLSLQDVRRVILESARKMDSLNGKVASGGMLDAYAALQQP